MRPSAAPSIASLQSAVGGSDDPLGIAVMQRAKQNRLQYEMAHPESMQSGPLPDPRWDGYFQAVDEAAGGRPVDFAGSAGPDLGFDTNNGTVGAGTEVYGPHGLRLGGTNAGGAIEALRRRLVS